MHNRIAITGRLQLFIDGVQVADHANKVTLLGCTALMQGWMGAAGYGIATWEGGTGTTAPTTADTALQISTYGPAAVSTASVTGSTTMEVTFQITPAMGEPDQDFAEFGLFCSNGDLFARWCDGNTYNYTAGATLLGVWTFTFTL